MKLKGFLIASLAMLFLASCDTKTAEGANAETAAPVVTESSDTSTPIDLPEDGLVFFDDEIAEVNLNAQSLSLSSSDLNFVTNEGTRFVTENEDVVDPSVFWASVGQGQSIMLEGIHENSGSRVLVETVIVKTE